MLGPVCCVTVAVPDLDAMVEAYGRHLGYTLTTESRLSTELADYLGAPALADARAALLRPESGDGFCFRFIEQRRGTEYRPLTTYGWNAAELIVRDVDALARRLADSPFRIIGPPEDLSFSDAIRAMQVIGPADEVLYLTMVKRALPEFDLPEPACDVDRAFIVILGGPDMGAMKRFYARRFRVPDAPVIEARISVLSRALGMPPETPHPIAALPLTGQSLIEVDAYPAGTTERRAAAGCLPPAIAMVSFLADALPADERQARLEAAPYDGRPSSITRGAAGELIELIAR